MNVVIKQQAGLSLQDIHRALNFDNKLQSVNSTAVYKSVLNKFYKFLQARGIPFEAVSKQIIIDFMNHQKAQGLKNVSINTSIKALKRLYKMFIEKGMIENNPAEDIAYFKEARCTSKGKWLDSEALAIVKAHLLKKKTERTIRDYAIFNFMVKTGVRANELCNIKFSDILYHNDQPIEVIIRHGKGDKERNIELNESILKPLQEYIELLKIAGYNNSDNDYLFLTLPSNANKNRRSINKRALFVIIQRIGKETGLNIHPHTLRHTFATHSFKNGASLIAVSHRLGHSSTNTTAQIYINDEDECLKFINDIF